MEVKAGAIYKHFKGNMYKVICLAKDSETGQMQVIYQALYGDNVIYSRPYEMFVSKVDKDKYPDALQENRFELWDTVSMEVAQPVVTRIEEADETSNLEEEYEIDPGVLKFLDAKSFEDKLTILAGLRNRITNEMLNTMAYSIDIELNEGTVEEKYSELLNCVSLREKFECNRLR